MGKKSETWDEFNPDRDLASLETLAQALIGEVRPADARLVWRAWRALGGAGVDAPDDGPTGVFAN